MKTRVYLLLGVAALASTRVLADGVLEINQTCATHGGCFAGDSAGFPVTIDGSAGVSYRLTGSLDLTTTSDTIGIEINGSNVTLDLNGFEIRGPVTCTGSGPSLDCGPVGSATGIRLNGGAEGGLIRNGTIRNMGGSGVASAAANHVTLKELRAINNAADGFRGGNSSVVTECIALRNGDDGFQFSIGTVIERSTAEGNGDNGIEIDAQRGVVRSSSTRRNGGRGFELGHSSKFSDNTSDFNSEPDQCGGGLCTSRKRYYRTYSTHDGASALDACADGFHMASLYEILDISNWQYDTVLGFTRDDSGNGPPTEAFGAWIRTGGASNLDRNCSSWTSNSVSNDGTIATPEPVLDLGNPDSNGFPWWIENDTLFTSCSTRNAVWCAED